MALSPIEDRYLSALTEREFPTFTPEESAMAAPEGVDGMQLAAGPSQTVSDAGAGMSEIKPIPRNKAQEALGYVGELLTKAGVQLDKYGVDIPGLGNITLKDLTVGDAGKVLEDMSFGFYPVRGGNSATGGIGTFGLKPDASMELLNVAPAAGAVAKAGVKAGVKGAMAVGRAGERLAEKTVPQIMKKGGTMAELMQALSQGSRSQLTAYHGTPHRVDQFDSKKIGTGEGNQTYGYGLYFAENPDVAKSYMAVSPSVMPPPIRTFKGAELEPGSPDYHAASLLDSMSLAQARKTVAGWLENPDPRMTREADGWRKTLDTLNSATSKTDFKQKANKGNLYTVDIPDEMVSKMLDFDKPLSQQPKNVQDALAKLGFTVDKKQVDEYSDALLSALSSDAPADLPKQPLDLSVESIYRQLTRNASSAQAIDNTKNAAAVASEALRQAGIPGIRYLDQGSRGSGKGTRNIVVFPGGEDQVKILKQEGKK